MIKIPILYYKCFQNDCYEKAFYQKFDQDGNKMYKACRDHKDDTM